MSKRILVVEDHEDNRQILRDLLGAAGYEMVEAHDGESGAPKVAAEASPTSSSWTSSCPARRLRGDAAHQGRSGAGGDPDHRRHLLCAFRRRGEGARCRLRRLCRQAL